MKFKFNLKNMKSKLLGRFKHKSKHHSEQEKEPESSKIENESIDQVSVLESEIKNKTAPVEDTKSKKKNKEKTEEEKEAEENLRMKRAFAQKKKKEKRRIAKILDEYLIKGGYELTGEEFHKRVKRATVISSIFASLVFSIIFALPNHFSIFIIFLLIFFGIGLGVLYLLILVGSFMFLDYQVYARTKEIEEVLPEFLQLTSANISAGMPIDRALWFAVRPKFGVLAKEIEEVAKATMAGEDLEEALENFTKKYDSKTLRESINLLVEGMRAGGEIGFLLNQIASNMQDIKIMRKEIAASVMSYVIFITAASIMGAPFLLALSSQLLFIMKGISSSVQVEDSGGSGSFKMDMSSDSISMGDFRIFAVVMIIFSSVFSAMIISVIRKGNTNESFKIIPGYIAISLIVFFAASAMFGALLGGFF